MNPRQRTRAALNHQTPDRTPVFEYVLLSPIADAFLGHPYAGDPANWSDLLATMDWETAVRQNARDRVRLAAVNAYRDAFSLPRLRMPS